MDENNNLKNDFTEAYKKWVEAQTSFARRSTWERYVELRDLFLKNN